MKASVEIKVVLVDSWPLDHHGFPSLTLQCDFTSLRCFNLYHRIPRPEGHRINTSQERKDCGLGEFINYFTHLGFWGRRGGRDKTREAIQGLEAACAWTVPWAQALKVLFPLCGPQELLSPPLSVPRLFSPTTCDRKQHSFSFWFWFQPGAGPFVHMITRTIATKVSFLFTLNLLFC